MPETCKPLKSVIKDVEESGTQVNDLKILVANLQDQNLTVQKKSYKKLFDFYAPRLKQWFLQNGLTDGVAEELAQDCMLTVWRKAGTYNAAKGSVNAWLYTIARNRRVDHFRREKYPEPVLNEHVNDLVDQGNYNNRYGGNYKAGDKTAAKIWSTEALTSLPKDQLQILTDIYTMGYSHEEIAQNRQIPLGTVKSRVRLALKKLKEQNAD